MAKEAEAYFPGSPSSAGAARSFVRTTLEDWDCEDPDIALLLTSEVVTNAIFHAASGLEVRLRLEEDVLVVEVADDSPVLPVSRVQPEDSISGRGIRMLSKMAMGWGITADPPGKRIWFTTLVRLSPDAHIPRSLRRVLNHETMASTPESVSVS